MARAGARAVGRIRARLGGLWLGLVAAWRRWVDPPPLPPAPPRSFSLREADLLIGQMALRLGFDRSERGPTTRLEGRRDAFEVAIEVRRVHWPKGQVRFEQQVQVTAPRPLASAPLAFVARPSGPRASGSGETPTRDPAFDREMRVEGPEDVALATLSAFARTVIGGNGGQWRIEGPILTWRAQRAPVFLSATTEQIVDLARAIVDGGADVVDRLAHRARHDPAPGIRRRALAALLRHHPADPRTRDTARAALDDRLPRLRLDAAIALGREGRRTLLDLLAHPSTPIPLRHAVAGHLTAGDEEARARLRALYARPGSDLEVRVGALELLGRLGSPEDLAFLEPLTRSFASRIRRAATEARSRILARHSDRAAGQLALAAPSDLRGAVSPPNEPEP